jgi:hypothetical protein
MKENFIKLLLIMGFYQLPSGNLAFDNQYHNGSLMIELNKYRWNLFKNNGYSYSGIDEGGYYCDLSNLLKKHQRFL